MKHITLLMLFVAALPSFAKNITLKLESAASLAKSKDPVIQEWAHETKFRVASLKLAKGSKSDPTNDVKIVAATVVKNAKTKKTFINDIQELPLDPSLANSPVTIMIATGAFEKRQDREDKAFTRGWMADGLIVEYWAGGKMQKRLATFSGPLAKTAICERDEKTKVLYLEKNCLYDEPEDRNFDSEPENFANRTLFTVGGKILNEKK